MADAQPSFIRFTVAAGMLAECVRECIVAIEQGRPADFWTAYGKLLQSREEYRASHPGKLNLLRARADRAQRTIPWQRFDAGLYHEVPLILAWEAFKRLGDPAPWKCVPATVKDFLGCDIPSTALTALVESIENEHIEYFYGAGENAGQDGDENPDAKLTGEAKALAGVVVEAENATGEVPAGKPPEPKPVAESACVKLYGRDDPPIVNGEKKPLLSKARYDLVLALITAGDSGLTKDQLIKGSKHGDPVKTMKRLAKSDPDWAAVLVFPGRNYSGGYRIK